MVRYPVISEVDINCVIIIEHFYFIIYFSFLCNLTLFLYRLSYTYTYGFREIFFGFLPVTLQCPVLNNLHTIDFSILSMKNACQVNQNSADMIK